MGHDRQPRGPGRTTQTEANADGPDTTAAPGKRTLSQSLDSPIDQLIAEARARGGAGLDGDLRAALETALGTSLGDVTLHTSSQAGAAARAVDADAFAIGTDVFFADGQHDPSTPQGRTLIAHEIAHTVQQRGATSTERSISAPSDRHEVEAERFASSFVAGEPAHVSTASISRGAISRQAAGTRPPPVVRSPGTEPADAFTIHPAQTTAVLGTSPTYSVPGALQQNPAGRYLCAWRVEVDPTVNDPRQRTQIIPTWIAPMPSVPIRWVAEGHHKLHCDLRWERDQNAPPGRLATPPPPPRRLELGVHVRAIENLSRDRFDDVARTDAYFDARLRDLVPEANIASGGQNVDDPRALAERRDRIRAQRENSDRIQSGRQVICRAQLTIRETAQTVPLAVAIGPARDEPGKLILIDFTPNQRRMDYGTAASTAAAVENWKQRNSYPAGLVEIDVPANEHGVAPYHGTFQTTGESSMGAWSSGLGTAGLVGAAAGGLALLASAPVSVPLLIISGIVAGVGSAVSLAERLHDARPSARGIAIDALGVVASVLGVGGLAAGVRTVTYAGRTMRVVDLTGRLAVAADGAAFALISADAIDEITRIWRDDTKSESDRMQAIAAIIARVTAQGGLLAVSGSQTLRAGGERGPGTPARDTDAPAPHDRPDTPAPATRAGDPNAGAVPASVVRAAQSPQEVLRAMQDEKARTLAGRVSSRDDGTWRELVDQETTFVRVIGQGELESLIGRGQVTTRRVETLMRDPVAANRELMDRLARRDADGRLVIPDELPVTSGGRQDPVLPISAFAPAETGYTASLTAERGQSFLVKFRPTVRRVASQNQDLRETEYFIPLWYRLDEVEWIADVRNNRWLWGAPGRAGTPEEAAALRRELGVETMPAAAPRAPLQLPPEVRREEELRAITRRVLDRAREAGDRELANAVNDLNARIEGHIRNMRSMRQRGTADEQMAGEELAGMERELATMIDRLTARLGPRAR